MDIGATLRRLDLSASDPDALAAFHASTLRMTVAREGDAVVCRGPGRELRFVHGAPGQLRRAMFAFAPRERLDAWRDGLAARGVAVQDIDAAGDGGCTVIDPEGRSFVFTVGGTTAAVDPLHASLPVARLQHFAVRTPAPAALVDFYAGTLGLVVSDRVHDAAGDLTAAFLRSDAEHHVLLAIFRAPQVRFDHFSCEAADWTALRDWADHMSEVGVDLAWGVGRHGPGNDTFLMVRDADDNMGEISCDLEVCAPGRPAGVWPHRPQTLTRWGVAIMRSWRPAARHA